MCENEEKLGMSVEEAANLIGVSRAFLYPWVMSGEIPSVKLGKRRIVPREALEAWWKEVSQSGLGEA